MALTSAELITLVSGSSVVSAVIGAWASRKAARAEVEITRFEAITTALDTRIKDLKDQLDEVKRDLNQLRSEYDREVDKHRKTRSHLQVAIDHIRDWLNWSRSDKSAPHPQVPQELGGLL